MALIYREGGQLQAGFWKALAMRQVAVCGAQRRARPAFRPPNPQSAIRNPPFP